MSSHYPNRAAVSDALDDAAYSLGELIDDGRDELDCIDVAAVEKTIKHLAEDLEQARNLARLLAAFAFQDDRDALIAESPWLAEPRTKA